MAMTLALSTRAVRVGKVRGAVPCAVLYGTTVLLDLYFYGYIFILYNCPYGLNTNNSKSNRETE
jgi:hypothetical protein